MSKLTLAGCIVRDSAALVPTRRHNLPAIAVLWSLDRYFDDSNCANVHKVKGRSTYSTQGWAGLVWLHAPTYYCDIQRHYSVAIYATCTIANLVHAQISSAVYQAIVSDFGHRSVSRLGSMSEEKKPFERLPTDVVPVNYKVELRPDLAAFTFQGKLEITVKVHMTVAAELAISTSGTISNTICSSVVFIKK